jgi:NAD(P)-dependent dehydrogenase (short-subunit alcohol dehydrogenase family)
MEPPTIVVDRQYDMSVRDATALIAGPPDEPACTTAVRCLTFASFVEGDSMRVVVVGASSGLGRSLAVGLASRGAQVAVLARRRERLDGVVAEIGAGAWAFECDVTDEASCRTAIADAAAALGGIDGFVYCPGVGPLRRLVDTDAATWHRVFDTNVTGAALTTAAALEHLVASGGTAAYLSSVSASLTPPWPGLGAYAVSKAALDKLVEAWRVEHPVVGFTRVVVGDCAGGEGESATEFPTGWDGELMGELAGEWFTRGLLSGGLMAVEELVAVVDTVLRCGVSIPTVTVEPRRVGAAPITLPTVDAGQPAAS